MPRIDLKRIGARSDVPIVGRLLLWSQALMVLFVAFAVGLLTWRQTGHHVDGRRFFADLFELRGILMLLAATVTAALVLAIRRLARHIDEQMRNLGSLDALTGLPNRAILNERLERENIAILYIDLDRFKVINDSLGHDTGDDVLKIVSQRIRRTVRNSDLVVRLGGDEFVVVVEDPDPEQVAKAAAERVLNALHAPLRAERREVFVTGSAGIAIKCAELSDPTELMRAADLALYRAKRQGRDQYVIFNQTMESDVLAQLDLESDLWRAIERGELEVHYQPEVGIESGQITGFEALVRWRHPERGLLKPASFIGLAEENGALREIGLWVIEESCRQWRRWQQTFAVGDNVALSVNLSLRQLEQPDLVERVEAIMRSTEMDPARLKLDVTESVLLSDSADIVSQLTRLRQMGIRLAIDDFGTGYSSLNYLKQLPVHGVKIDQSFVRNLDEDDASMMIVQAIVTMAHDLGLDVTAEGVETREQLDHLVRLGCDRGQGYYLSEPQPPETIDALLAAYAAGKGRLQPAA